MVHHRQDGRYAVQPSPPTCPKCGSHRTEIVGRSDDGLTLTIRCNACGERSARVAELENGAPGEDMTREIEAIRRIGDVLTNLPDAGSRARVLRWAYERFELGSPSAAFAMEPDARVSDPTLAIGELTEFFSPVEPPSDDDSIGDILMPDTQPAAVQTAAPQLGPLVHSFVAEFQRLADEWQTAFAPTGPDVAVPVTVRR